MRQRQQAFKGWRAGVGQRDAARTGLPAASGYHAGKILECAALCAVPGTTKDCMLGTITPDGFRITPLSAARKCTSLSVAAHTFYEKDHPYILHGPGTVLDLENCRFTEMGSVAGMVPTSSIFSPDYSSMRSSRETS